MTQKVTQYTE